MWPVVKELESSFPPHFEPLERARTKFLKFGVEKVRSVPVGPQPATAVGQRGVQQEVKPRLHQRPPVIADEVEKKVLVLLEFLAVAIVHRQAYCPCPGWCGFVEPF